MNQLLNSYDGYYDIICAVQLDNFKFNVYNKSYERNYS